jgi:pilus assembly protein TadC
MSIAETALTIGGIVFTLLVLPTLLDDEATVPRKQSIPTSIVLFAFFTIPYGCMGLVFPAVSSTLGSLLWGLVAVYRSPETNVYEESYSTDMKTAPGD